VLALSALMISYIDPSEPDRFVVVTYTTLALYSAYSAALYLLPQWRRTLLPLHLAHLMSAGIYYCTHDWSTYQLDRFIPPQTEAIKLVLQRQNCTIQPCPIFGRLWLDAFTLD